MLKHINLLHNSLKKIFYAKNFVRLLHTLSNLGGHVTSQRHAAYVESILCYSRSICTPCYAHPVIFIIIPVGIVPTEHLLFVKEYFFEQHQKEAFTGASFLMQFNLGIQTKLRSNKAKHRR